MKDDITLNELIALRDTMRQVQQRYAGGVVTVGDFTYGVPTVYYRELGFELKIGKFCSMSEFINIFLGGEHRTNWVSTYPFHMFTSKYAGTDCYPSKGGVTIGNDVWIASTVTILSGVKIGNGASIGANTVVAKDVPDYAIVCGNPARIIKYRFDEDTIKRLLEIAWWDWDLKFISEAIPIILSNNIEELFNYYDTVVAKESSIE